MSYTINHLQDETRFLEYKNRQKAARLQVARLHAQCLAALTAYEEMAHWLDTTGGDDLLNYNAANVQLLGGAEDMLQGLTVALMEHIAAMQSAMPDGYNLFPGVPRNVEPAEIMV
jgi:hypothetical protein